MESEALGDFDGEQALGVGVAGSEIVSIEGEDGPSK
jgi:hypothetical protein